jgi:6-bladed beta-propeller
MNAKPLWPSRMKILVWICSLVLFCAASLSAQEIIRNPARPVGKDPGRTLELLEVLRIKDTGDKFYFRGSPGGFTSLGMDAGGNIYVQNDKDQILKFTPEGSFVKNIVRGGQGPGEVSQYYVFLVGEEDVFIHDFGQDRIIRLTTDGRLIHQWRATRAYNDLIGILKDGLVFSRSNNPPLEERKGKLMDVPHEILRVSLDGSEEKLVGTYPVLRFLGQGYAASWAPFYAALSDGGRYLFVNHTAEYEISMLDLDTGKIVKTFRRKYRRIPHVPFRGEAEFNKKYNFKKPYDADIRGLYVLGDKLWVRTSTEDKAKGTLYDVYSYDGIYQDAFFLKKNLISLQRGNLLTWETDEEGIQSMVIYRPK